LIINFRLNGRPASFDCPPVTRLLDALRAGDTCSVKEGCGEGECGACSIIMDGELVTACLVPAIEAEGSEIITLEGAGKHRIIRALQKAFHFEAGSQCGYCTPGMILASAVLLLKNEDPDEHDIRVALGGNLCRCTGYVKIIHSVRAAAAEQRNSGDAHA
jgi:aerobic-type carbon monoxide dehydrogenase small subunit (CoxS/CutS family)